MNCKIHAYSLTGFPPPANDLLHITRRQRTAATLCEDLVLTHLPLVIPSMPGNDQSFGVDTYLHYIFGEENEPEQVGEQELHRPVQAPWPIGSDIGVTVLGSTIDILQRRCDEQFSIHHPKIQSCSAA